MFKFNDKKASSYFNKDLYHDLYTTRNTLDDINYRTFLPMQSSVQNLFNRKFCLKLRKKEQCQTLKSFDH